MPLQSIVWEIWTRETKNHGISEKLTFDLGSKIIPPIAYTARTICWSFPRSSKLGQGDGEFNLLSNALFGFPLALTVLEIIEVFRSDVRNSRNA